MPIKNDRLKFQLMSQSQLNIELIDASWYSKLEIVQYLLTSPDLKKHADIHAQNDGALRCACKNGNLNIVKYLLTSPDLNEHADIYAQDDDPITIACIYGHLEIVKYLLASPELKKHVDIHTQNDSSFINSCLYDKFNIIQFLIFNYNIELTERIENYLVVSRKYDILNVFEKRNLEKKLQKNLIENNQIENKIKL